MVKVIIMVNPQVTSYKRDLTVAMVCVPPFIPLPCLHSVGLTRKNCAVPHRKGRRGKSQEEQVHAYG